MTIDLITLLLRFSQSKRLGAVPVSIDTSFFRKVYRGIVRHRIKAVHVLYTSRMLPEKNMKLFFGFQLITV